MQGMLGPRGKVVNSVCLRLLCGHFFPKSGEPEKSKNSAMKVTFNVYHEIEEIQDPMSHHIKELKTSWGYANSVNLRGKAQMRQGDQTRGGSTYRIR